MQSDAAWVRYCRVMMREPCCCVIGWEGVTCRVGRGRGRVPEGPTLLLSSSRARVRRSNCISCSRTEARRDAAFSHCSIHTERKRTGVTHSRHEIERLTHSISVLKKRKKRNMRSTQSNRHKHIASSGVHHVTHAPS